MWKSRPEPMEIALFLGDGQDMSKVLKCISVQFVGIYIYTLDICLYMCV